MSRRGLICGLTQGMRRSFRKRFFLARPVTGILIDLPGPPNLSIWWNFGSLLGVCLVLQILTGVFLAIHYTPEISLAFSSCIHISREVNFGWLIRSIHANGASFFFFFLYLHIGRGLYYGSYKLLGVWLVGVILFLVSMGTAFLGYVLVWGQIRLWAATVITRLLSAIPIYGPLIVEWIWGGFSVRDATLHRFFVFHFLCPFILVVFSIIHIMFLHQSGSNSPLGVNRDIGRIPFHPYYRVKDLVGIFFIVGGIGLIVLLSPDLFVEPENFIPANPLVTPNHIKPEWYFLWLYAVLRAVPNKLGGVIAIFAGILCLAFLPFLLGVGGVGSGCGHSVVRQLIFWALIRDFLVLTWLGRCPAEAPFNFSAQACSFSYFRFFIIFPIWRHFRLKWRAIVISKEE